MLQIHSPGALIPTPAAAPPPTSPTSTDFSHRAQSPSGALFESTAYPAWLPASPVSQSSAQWDYTSTTFASPIDHSHASIADDSVQDMALITSTILYPRRARSGRLVVRCGRSLEDTYYVRAKLNDLGEFKRTSKVNEALRVLWDPDNEPWKLKLLVRYSPSLAKGEIDNHGRTLRTTQTIGLGIGELSSSFHSAKGIKGADYI